MTHDEIVAEIQDRARARGVLSHYCGTAVRCQGDRGQPDLMLVGRYSMCFAEVKGTRARLTPEQTTWRHALLAAGERVYVWHEPDLTNGNIDQVLHVMASGIWSDPSQHATAV